MSTILILVTAAAGSALFVHALDRWEHAQLQMARLRFQRDWEQRQQKLKGR